MLVAKPASKQEISVHTLGRDLLVRPGRPLAGKPGTASSDELLQLAVLADSKGTSGMALAVHGAAKWRWQWTSAGPNPPTLGLMVSCPTTGTAASLPEVWISGFHGPWDCRGHDHHAFGWPGNRGGLAQCCVLSWAMDRSWTWPGSSRPNGCATTRSTTRHTHTRRAVADHLARVRQILATRTSASPSPAPARFPGRRGSQA